MRDARRPPAPWVFSLLILPLGISVGFKFTALPFLLAKAGVPIDRIATIASMVHLPAALQFLWAPLVDVKLRRRIWLVIGALTSSLCFCFAIPLMDASHLRQITALLLSASLADSLVAVACGGLLVTMLSAPAQAKASAWQNAGQLGGGALGSAAVIWLATHTSLPAVGVFVAAMIALPALSAFTFPEPAPLASQWFRGRLPQIGKEIWALVRSADRRWSTLLLLAPCGTGAAMGLLPAIASHYGVGASGVMWINAAAGGVVLALGSLFGALVPSDWDRRLTYAGACMTNALAIFVLLAANRPSSYLVGTVLYLLTNGFVWARFTALLVEIIGAETRDASAFYGAFNAAGLLPLSFMIWLDGFGFHKLGMHGLLWTDAVPNLLAFAIVVIVFATRGLGLRRVSTPRVSTHGASSS